MGNLQGESLPDGVVSLPVIDLSLGRAEVGRAILNAGKEIGFFQVINHGISDEAIRDMEAMCEEYFAMPEEDRLCFHSDDNGKPNRFFSGSTYETGGACKYWFDCLRLTSTFPIGDSKEDWPEKPKRLREVFGRFAELTRGMGMELLRLLCEAMGLPLDYFEGGLGNGNMAMTLNRYPACPDPGTMIGLPPHCDRNLLSLLLPSTVPGLQFSYNGKWANVETLPNAYIVNFGLPLEVVTNGVLRSIEHQVVTNRTHARRSVGLFITPAPDCLIGPAKEFLSKEKPARYRAVTYDEFYRMHSVVKHGLSSVLTINADGSHHA
ncbi:2'-deoxymugineic-acid 2'-dioxygenase [Brachypodium distachyon]|uniref:Fe2OG dioxygenase domain-containing protein n=1 Tax=Brachypodium distachyon TaxID=15368 RepID=I1IUR4_BRADI|nr:2'-deoxymugineic-acid 2'-dioxygenase [Brachypodium distachyon]KQJ92427.1 hypothetical protein BRADI_4g43610v3 [Brachypodium distachyon]|eukprot:XP_010238775.2 2'-deoxymugineic-acid 2'-dioxygenase [Brachypodium distachyon]